MTASEADAAAERRPFRLVATDLDGTLLRSDGTVSPRTRAALDLARAAGAHLVLATGRPQRWMPMVEEQLEQPGIAVCSNGAFVYDLADGTVLSRTSLDPDVGMAVVEAVRASVPGASFGAEHGDAFGHEPAFPVAGDFGELYAAPVEDLFARPVVKLLVRHDGHTVDELAMKVRQAVGDLVEVTFSGHSPLAEIAVKGVSKASRLAWLCAERNIDPSEVVAFGDMPNDLAMLTWAGRAYAVGSAHPDVLAVVDHRAPGNDEDGVAQILEQLFG